MGLFGRRHDDAPGPGAPAPVEVDPAFADVEDDDGRPLRPTTAPPSAEDLARIAGSLEALVAEGVDIDVLTSLSDGYDRAYAAWAGADPGSRADHAEVVARYACGIGEHLHRHTDLDWAVVTDVFGTDLAVAGGVSGAFTVVPSNLVAARWMRGETGWIQGVVGHLVTLRSRRR